MLYSVYALIYLPQMAKMQNNENKAR